MPEIHLLSQSTIDQIAAGEVVERPASVVKELVENAIDAGANAVTVEIKDGGLSLIRVTDNGCGIDKTQIKRAFLRHATSKISSIDDLSFVESLGFRGEALSSIAAVAQVEAITKTEEELTGIRYAIAGGEEEDVEEIGAPKGTTFLVHNLFYNTPARRKFMKQPKTEGGYVSDLMEHIALSRPDVSFKFVNGGAVRFHTSGNGDLKEVVYRIYGREMADSVIPFEEEGDLCHISGYIGKPEINRSSRAYELFFVNGRFVRDDLLSKALEEGYRQYVMQHKFPFAVLHISIEPKEIDVNVHPSKMQIRIQRGNEMFSFLSENIKKRLHELEMIPKVLLTEEKEEAPQKVKTPEPFETRRIENLVQEERKTYQAAATDRNGEGGENSRNTENGEKKQEESRNGGFSGAETGQNIPVDRLDRRLTSTVLGAAAHKIGTPLVNDEIRSNVIKAADHIFVEKPVQMNLFEEKILTRQARNEYKILGQIFDTYWLMEYRDKLLIIDQHAAHEKVKYERLVKQLREKQAASQLLSPPVILNLSGKEEIVFKQYREYFEKMGFEAEEFGTGAYAIRSVPTDLYGCDEKELFFQILDELSEVPARGEPDVVLQKLASMACKSAVKGNNSMDRKEMEALIDELLTLENPYHCPHGRPTIITMSKYEIEKKFKRIVT